MLENKRLITKAERDYIENNLDLKKHKRALITLIVIYFILLLIICIGAYFIDSIKGAIIAFIFVNSLMIYAVVPPRYQMIKLFQKDEIWVREAIFDSINKYHDAWFEINNHGKRELVHMGASLQEFIRKGDKVIIVKTRSFRGVFLARE